MRTEKRAIKSRRWLNYIWKYGVFAFVRGVSGRVSIKWRLECDARWVHGCLIRKRSVSYLVEKGAVIGSKVRTSKDELNHRLAIFRAKVAADFRFPFADFNDLSRQRFGRFLNLIRLAIKKINASRLASHICVQ
mgnify:CR=1 FL=1